MTFLLATFIIWFIHIGGPEEWLRLWDAELERKLSPNVIAASGDLKYMIVPAVAGIVVWLSGLVFKRDNVYLDTRQSGSNVLPYKDGFVRLAAKYAVSIALLIIFVFSMIMLLPQYPYLAAASYFFPFV